MILKLTVYGTPQPQGSMRAFMPKGFKRPIITADNTKTKPWRQEIAGVAVAAMNAERLTSAGKDVPISVRVVFYFEPLKGKKREFKVSKTDTDKLCRSLGDALTGIVFADDSQAVEWYAIKRYGSPARAEIEIAEVGMVAVEQKPTNQFQRLPF